MAPKKILYIDGDGPFGGASRSLYEAVQSLPKGAVDAFFIAVPGTALDFYKKVAVDVITTRGLTKFDNTRISHYRGVRWLVLLREIYYIPFTIICLLNARMRWRQFDLIHVNELVYIIPALFAKFIFRAPLIVHVRSMACKGKPSWRSKLLNSILRNKAAAIIAIDGNVRGSLVGNLPVSIINNSFSAMRAANAEMEILRKFDALRPGSLKVGFVGNLHHSKGLFDILAAAKLVSVTNYDVEFVIVGGVTRVDKGLKSWILARAGLAQNVQTELAERIDKEGLSGCVHMFGPTYDIKPIYDRLDILLFPSHLDALGRPVFEAAFSSVPSVVCVSNPSADTLIHGETGFSIPERCPAKLAEAILYFAAHPSEVRRMGENAKQLAELNFSPKINSTKLLDVYRHLSDHSQLEKI